MCDIQFSADMVRDVLAHPSRTRYTSAQALVAFEVVIETHEAVAQMLHAAIEKQQDAELALSALRHPSDSIDDLKQTLRKLADIDSPAFEQVMDELIAEVRLECAPVVHG